jgi:hypothetical protein
MIENSNSNAMYRSEKLRTEAKLRAENKRNVMK